MGEALREESRARLEPVSEARVRYPLRPVQEQARVLQLVVGVFLGILAFEDEPPGHGFRRRRQSVDVSLEEQHDGHSVGVGWEVRTEPGLSELTLKRRLSHANTKRDQVSVADELIDCRLERCLPRRVSREV